MAVDTLRQSSIATISIAFGRWPPHFEPMNPFWTRKSTCCCSMFPLFLLCAACWCVGAGGFLFFSFVTDIFCCHCSLPVVDMELTTAHWVLCSAMPKRRKTFNFALLGKISHNDHRGPTQRSNHKPQAHNIY